MPPKRVKPTTIEDPEELPTWQASQTPAVIEQSAEPDVTFDSDFDRDFHDLINARFETNRELMAQAVGFTRVAQVLGTARRRVDHYIGEMAMAVEDYGIWKYHPDAESMGESFSLSYFWEHCCGISMSVVRNAIQLRRHGLPVAQQVGVDIVTPSINGELTRAKAQAVTTIAKQAEKTGALATIAGQQTVREQMENVLGAPSNGEVYAMMRDIQGKPERVACFLEAEVVTDEFSPPKIRLRGDITKEQAEAGEAGVLYFMVKFGDRVVQFRELSQVLHDIGGDEPEEEDLFA